MRRFVCAKITTLIIGQSISSFAPRRWHKLVKIVIEMVSKKAAFRVFLRVRKRINYCFLNTQY